LATVDCSKMEAQVYSRCASAAAASEGAAEAATLDAITRYVQEVDKLEFDLSFEDACCGKRALREADEDTTCDAIEWYVQDIDGLVFESPTSSVSSNWTLPPCDPAAFGEKTSHVGLDAVYLESDASGDSSSSRSGLSLASAGVDSLWDDEFMLPPPAIDLDVGTMSFLA